MEGDVSTEVGEAYTSHNTRRLDVDGVVEKIMGKKDEERSNQAYIISSRGKNGVGNTGILRQLFVSLNDVVYTRWPFSKRWKVALPAGWIYFGARQAFKIARGERKRIHLGKMVDGAIARRELYRQFGIFERE